MPGHKSSGLTMPRLAQAWGQGLLALDLSEMSGVDYLEAPAHTLAEAQALAAEAFGAEYSCFLVNGTTVGNQAMLLAAVQPGQDVILPRASHRSVFAALMLADARPVYVPPEFHPAAGLPLATPAGAVRDAIAAHPDAAALHLTSPTYYGFCSDLDAIEPRSALPLLVDEAHGAHFAFHEGLPRTALRAGANLTVQSLHKTGGSLYQSSLLHGQAGPVGRAAVEQALGWLQSSSPSSLLLASLDEARSTLAVRGREMLDRCIALAHEARRLIREMPGLGCYGDELVADGGVAAYDPTKLLVRLDGLSVNGYQAASWLMDRFAVEPEFAETRHLLFALTLVDERPAFDQLLAGLGSLAEEFGGTKGPEAPEAAWPAIPAAALPLRAAAVAGSRPVRWQDAVGEVSAESVIPYPPGVPIILPGEIVSSDVVAFVQSLVAQGAGVVGLADRTCQTLRVVTRA